MIKGEKTLFIDTPPDLRHQCIRENVRRIDEVLYTHCHSDHVGGLLELEYLVQLKQKEALPSTAAPRRSRASRRSSTT